MAGGEFFVLDGSAEAREMLVQVRALGTDAEGRSVPVCAACNGAIVDGRFVHESWCPYYEHGPSTLSRWWSSTKEVVTVIFVVALGVFLVVFLTV